MYGLPKFEARVTVPAGGYAIAVTDSGGTSSVTVPAARYFLVDLLAALVTALNADATLAGTYTAVLDDDSDTTATGRVTLSATGGGNISVTWTSTVLRDLLGFTASLSGAATYQGTKAAKPLHLPDVPRCNPLVPEGMVGIPISNVSQAKAPSGQIVTLSYGDDVGVDSWEMHFLSGRKTWTQYETYDNEALQTFWAAYVKTGAPIRFYPDRSVDGTYVTWIVSAPQMFPAQPEIAGYVGGPDEGETLRWHIGPVPVSEYIA